jgi:hypothetical protein
MARMGPATAKRMITPEGETFESMTSRPATGVPGSKSRLPLPTMTGNVQMLSPSACRDRASPADPRSTPKAAAARSPEVSIRLC